MLNLTYSPNQIQSKRHLARELLLTNSKNIKIGDIKTISTEDLWLLFHIYDEVFLNNFFKSNYKGSLKFSLSRQMTSAAGITKVQKNISTLLPEQVKVEIKMSVNFLFDYNKLDRQKEVNGILTKDSLDALMLVFEHELCHFIEFLLFHKSSCKQERFKKLANNIFGHTATYHKLPSKKEINHIKYEFKPGDTVTFSFEGRTLKGIINAINKRATVMVENKDGIYIDKQGKRYAKYYIPLSGLKLV